MGNDTLEQLCQSLTGAGTALAPQTMCMCVPRCMLSVLPGVYSQVCCAQTTSLPSGLIHDATHVCHAWADWWSTVVARWRDGEVARWRGVWCRHVILGIPSIPGIPGIPGIPDTGWLLVDTAHWMLVVKSFDCATFNQRQCIWML